MQEHINQSETGLEDVNLFPFRRKIVAMNQVINRIGVVLKGLFCLFFSFVSFGGWFMHGVGYFCFVFSFPFALTVLTFVSGNQ